MNLIKNNPYRTVGLLVGATAKEQARQISRLKKYIEAEQDPQDYFSFPALGELHRTLESVEEAASKLNLDNDKINAALFWFWNGNPITDEAALDALKEGKILDALNIWSELTDKDITSRNASSFHNLSVLKLSIAIGHIIIESALEQAIILKLKFLESNFVNELIGKVTDDIFKISKKGIQLLFLNQLQSEIKNKISSSKFFEILNKQEFFAKEDFLKGFVQNHITQIEQQIETAKNKRKANKANAAKAGTELHDAVINQVLQLMNILGIADLKYSSISDRVANEILQCGIDYFKYYQDRNTDPGSTSLDLFKKAKILAVGGVAKHRVQENIENLQKWINDKPIRDKLIKVDDDFKRLKDLIDRYEGLAETVANANQLLASARLYLYNISRVLGRNDENYLGISTRIASDAQGMCVSEINKLQERFANTYDASTKVAAIFSLKQKVDESWEVTNTISAMDLRSDFRSHVNQNKNSLSGLRSQLSQVTTGSGGSSSSSGGGGCYIATMAYGSYEHPQVLELRKFRDECLAKTIAGRMFIQTYYFISPKLVELLKNQKIVNTLIRKALNQFIKVIKK
ncbi:MAG: hypothetical protein B6D37_13265 [Sphingobacteriales bacterium UTBCD1]|jgi:hypothetical protein|nr:MAG: hypothetical protein B6D37_13265 [Sphingobacteriales bacterium UTBCD1]